MLNKNQTLRRRTKIIATLGPATDDPVVLEQIILAGVNVVRLNFSHGSHEEHRKRIEAVRKIAAQHDGIVGILADLQGPKIRIANFKEGKVTLRHGDIFCLDASCDPNLGNHVQVGIDYKELPAIVISFPRSSEDILEAKRLIEKLHGEAGVIAKIERAEAVDDIDGIIKASDGVMVARGDLAVEIGDAEVPFVQERIIHRARTLDKPVITATQMLESMIFSTVPTRAEVSDVAYAVMENTDAVMLSAETAVGQNPVKSVMAMSRVCLAAERKPRYQRSSHRLELQFERTDEAIAMATMYTANHLDTKAIIALTESGTTTLWMSRIRTAMPIYGLSRIKKTLGRMSLYRGVYPIAFDVTQFTRDDVNKKAVEVMEQLDVLSEGDLVILTKGDHLGVGGGSNAMKILKVGEIA